MKTSIITVAVLTALSTAALASSGATHGVRKTSGKVAPLICPVTGTKIASANKAYNHEIYKGKTYYFCCPECKPAFDKNPTKVITNAAKGKYQPM